MTENEQQPESPDAEAGAEQEETVRDLELPEEQAENVSGGLKWSNIELKRGG
jgi:hypothetical protein